MTTWKIEIDGRIEDSCFCPFDPFCGDLCLKKGGICTEATCPLRVKGEK